MNPRHPLNPHHPRHNPARGRPPRKGGLSAAALGVVALLIPPLALLTSDGLRAALDFTSGVLSLVSLTASVAWGLLATDRLLLTPRDRLMAQAVHRATAIASIGFLLLHVTLKIALGHVGLLGAVVPFGLGITGTSGLIGFGSLAGILMVLTAVTGAMRSAFTTPGRIAGRWRAVHMLAYPTWCSALVHGLFAGRPPAGWVVAMYALSLAAVAGALAVRALPRPAQRRIVARLAPLLARPEPERPEATPPPPPVTPPSYEAPSYEASSYGTSSFVSPLASSSSQTASMEAASLMPPSYEAYEARPTRRLRAGRPRREVLGEARQSEETPALYEPPHEAPPRYRPGNARPVGDAGTGISAAYRAVSLAPPPPAVPPATPPDARWAAPSPRPPEPLPNGDPAPSTPYQQPTAGEPWHSPPGPAAGERP
ncbi:ferric reductase-like transmembrane domain-containing protein [Streptomyces sp. NPDC006660]|uniref:ferric reductase-like transmembrane domain-containing protein n=1 Tax=Streptomyces sp. NPDC006660 TaxID=3156901 RepID=UPI0033EEEDE6